MSDSDEGALQIDLDRIEKSPASPKKHKEKRSGESLKVIETAEEKKYRSYYTSLDVVKNFPDLIKCTKCMHSFKSAIIEGKKIHTHPILEVLMCEPCCLFYGNGEFSLDEDDEDKYCRWCGEGGKIFLCSECICGFCPLCIKKHFGKEKVKEIQKDDEWVCFICDPKPIWKLRAICSLAINQSMVNKLNVASGSETPKKKLPKLRNSKQHTLTKNVSCEPAKNKGGSDSEDMATSSKETPGNQTKMFRSKRKRILSSKSKGKGKRSPANDQSDASGEPPKKMRSTSEKSTEKMRANQNENKANGANLKVSFSSSSSSSSSLSSSSPDPSDDEDENDNEMTLHELNKKQESLVAKSKSKNLDKLKNIFTIAETVSQLCVKMCQKKMKKLDKNLLSDEKLLPECEKLRSMIILMSCSLSTIHNLIISLQQKCKMKEKLDIQLLGKQDSTLLEAIGKILREKGMKTSYYFNIVNDILNRYPFIEVGVKNFNNYICDMVSTESKIGFIQNDTCQCIKVNSAEELGGRNEQKENSKKEIIGGAAGLIPDDTMDVDFNTAKDSSEKVTCETDVRRQILEPDSNPVPNNNEHSEQSPSPKGSNVLSTSQRKYSASDVFLDVEKLYFESLKLRKKLMLSSGDESSYNGEESEEKTKVSNNLLRPGSSSRVKRKAKKQASRSDMTKEEREIRNLMNLSSIERSRRKMKSKQDSIEKSNLEGRKTRKRQSESSSSESTTLHTDEYFSDSQMHIPFGGEDFNMSREYDFEKESAEMLKRHFLQTSNSSNDSQEDPSPDEKPKEVKRSTKRSIKVEKRDPKKKDKSDWRSDYLLRASLSFADPKKAGGASEREEGGAKKPKEEAIATESSSSSLNISSMQRRKRTRVLSSSPESDVEKETGSQSILETPSKGRRNIKKIVKTGNLQMETRQAVKAENERKKRVADRKKIYEESFPNMLESDRLVLDFDLDTKEVLLEVPPELAKKLKPHQKEGIKFMWDCCFESLDSLETTNGSGCVLAHCMGLGKTLQIISLIFTILKNGIGMKTILILCPLNVISNWVDEFEVWLKDLDFEIELCNLNAVKGVESRFMHLQEWQNDGGVMIVSYDLLRTLTNVKRRSKTASEKASNFSKLLINPGPDLVICDEGHLLKNQGTLLSQCLADMNTSRRIILTGTPLQNNLVEYHSMVHFIKPNILGTRREFMNRFGNPIMNGQFEDSTAKDVKLMRARSHVLHKLLDGCIQRFSYSVLTPYLPERHEYVVSIRLTESQVKLYQYYLSKCRRSLTNNKTAKLFSDFHLLQRVWTHPRMLATYGENEDHADDDLDGNKTDCSSSGESVICLDTVIKNCSSSEVRIQELLNPEEFEEIQSSGKLVLLLHILSRCRQVGDKVLVFSQSLNNLNLIEYFLHKIHSANKSASEDLPAQYRDTWEKGIDYYRMEGSTSNESRTRWCKSFNNKENKRLRLFLISTKAGGLGINLIGANRVIIFDVSWNPSHDVQSIFRVYRFGQRKTCYIYRFVAEGTMEEKIYARQVTKLSLEKRVLDEQQIERHYTMGNLQELYAYDPIPEEKWTVPLIPKDMILAEIINNKNLIASYHEHDSLLEDKEEEKLTEEERKAAWEDFEKEKFMAEYELGRYNARNVDNPPGTSSVNMETFQTPNPTTPFPQFSNPNPNLEYLRNLYIQQNGNFSGQLLQRPPCITANPFYRAREVDLEDITANITQYENLDGFLDVLQFQINKHCTDGQSLKDSLNCIKQCLKNMDGKAGGSGGPSCSGENPETAVSEEATTEYKAPSDQAPAEKPIEGEETRADNGIMETSESEVQKENSNSDCEPLKGNGIAEEEMKEDVNAESGQEENEKTASDH